MPYKLKLSIQNNAHMDEHRKKQRQENTEKREQMRSNKEKNHAKIIKQG